MNNIDETDHHVQSPRQEITIAVGGDNDGTINIKTTHPTPTPSPRSLQSSQGADEISSNSTDDDNAILTPGHTKHSNDAASSAKPNGIDNPAFENDNNKTSQQRPLSSFVNGGNGIDANGKGHTNNTGAVEKPLAEAVNLELVNFNKPAGGVTKVEIGNDPYDEYFVPVNEHRKYMSVSFKSRKRNRGVDQWGHSLNEPVEGIVDYKNWRKIARGEKLYVMKDKRIKSSKWRKRLAWVAGLSLCAALIILGILAATGVIAGEDEPIESRQFNDKTNAAGIFGVTGKRKNESQTVETTSKSPNVLYVPNTLNGRLKIDNTEFLDQYSDHNSFIYKTLTREIEEGIEESLADYNDAKVKVLNLTAGSVIVDYRVSWSDEDALSEQLVENSLKTYLKENHGYLFAYFVPVESLTFSKQEDSCAMQSLEMKCAHGCHFNQKAVDFECLPTAEPEPSGEPETVVEPHSEHDATSSSEPEPKGEPESLPDSDHEHIHAHNEYETETSSEPLPESHSGHYFASSEPSFEPESSSRYSAVDAVSEPEPKGEPESSSEPKGEPETSSEPEPKGEPETSSEPEPKGEPETSSEIEPKGEPETSSEPEPKGEPETSSEPEPQGEPETSSEPELKGEPETSGEPEPKGEPETSSEPEPKGTSSEPEPKVEPETSSEPEPKGEPETSSEPEPIVPITESEPTSSDSSTDVTKMETSVLKNKNGKELTYESNEQSEKETETATILPSPVDEVLVKSVQFENSESAQPRSTTSASDSYSEETSTRRQIDTSEYSSSESSETSPNTLSSSSEQPAPVTEDLSDDTPMPTEKYFHIPKSIEQRTELNVMDGTTTPRNIQTTSATTIYSTTAPLKVEYDETSLRNYLTSSSSQNPMYSVTENILEHDAAATPVGNSIHAADQPIDQSPFLPEVENNETLLSILHGGHDIDVHNETDDLRLKYESDDANANLIEGPISVQKVVPLQAVSSTTENLPKSSTTTEALETSLNETQRDSTEVYNLQESRSHNIENGIAAETESENESGTTENVDSSTELTEENNTRSISSSKTDANSDMDSTEKQTELDLIPATEPISEPSSEPSPSSSSTTDVNAEGSSTEKLLEAEQTEMDMISATEPASEPSPSSSSSSLEPSTEPASEPTAEKSTETSMVLNTSEASKPEELSSSSIAPSTSSESSPAESSSQSTPSSSTTELPVVVVTQISSSEGPSSSTEVDATDVSLEQTALDSTESLESSSSKVERSSSTESSSSSTEPIAIKQESDTELKVIPLPSSTTTAEDPPPDNSTASNETNTASEESTETTTGHFLSKATFHLNSNDSFGTSEPSDKTQTPQTMMTTTTTTTTTVAVPMERSNFNYSRCTAGQFECQNGTSIRDGSTCINQNERCDSIFQCSDRSDETDCELLGCPGHFQCSDGACLTRSQVCDSVVHCRDGSDETEDLCKSWQCKFDEIACGPLGPCLPSIQQCDGIQNCANQADEANCPEKTCKSNQFYCSWQRKCIPETWVCDGKIDCLGGGEDERLCDCQPDEFKCNSGGCVSVEYVCDGQPQCPDLSDEFNCFNLTETDTIESINTALQVKRYNNQFAFVCAENFTQKNAKGICNELGFAGVSEWSNHSLLTNEVNLVRITSDDESSFLANLNSTNKCENDLVIALECEQFSCGNQMLRQKESGSTESKWPTLATAFHENSTARCTATIIAPQWALASYSCLIGNDVSTLRTEINWTLQIDGNDENSTQQLNIERIYTYPQVKFKHLLYSGNAVLLRLSKPLAFTDTLAIACLSAEPLNESDDCISAGWLINEDLKRKNYVNHGQIKLITNDECNSTTYYSGSLADDSICIERENSTNNNDCYNDAGAPLICYSDAKSTWEVKGVLSYHSGCRRHPQPNVYSRLTGMLLDWITNTVGNAKMIHK